MEAMHSVISRAGYQVRSAFPHMNYEEFMFIHGSMMT
jgi:hypothetical protein